MSLAVLSLNNILGNNGLDINVSGLFFQNAKKC